jgi:endonuclease-3
LLVAVVLSAQCTDKKVNEITPGLFREAPTPERMRHLGEERILELIRPLGLSKQKAKSLAGLSEMLVKQFGGEVPRTFEELESLPGVGHKTASVVMAQAFGKPAFPVDTHIHRLAQRWGLTSGTSVEQTERDLKRLFPQESWNDLHLQIIFYGREHCTARGCDGTRCGLCRELFPNRKKPVVCKKP